ncbi:unnamed protein product [Umbelopsis ramanniana]
MLRLLSRDSRAGLTHQQPFRRLTPNNAYTSPTRRSFTRSTIRRTEQETAAKETESLSTGGPVHEQEAMMYLDNTFPLRVGFWDVRQYLFRNTENSIKSKIDSLVPKDKIPCEFAVEHAIPRTKDGGAFVQFKYKSDTQSALSAPKVIMKHVTEHLQEHNTITYFNFQPVRAFLVKGEPFMEDIVSRYPSLKLKVEFQGSDLTIEQLYNNFRPYGRIFDISILSPASKELPRYAMIQFTRMRSATSARNCLHGLKLEGTRLNIGYESQMRTNIFKQWVVDHPRITVPVVAASLAGVTYVIFDPIRVFFIHAKVTQRFNPDEYALYRWLRRETWARLMSHNGDDSTTDAGAWADREEDGQKIKEWLNESPETFIVISGPKGSGKSALIKGATDKKRNIIRIQGEELANARNKNEITTILAKQLGYYPVFTWISSLNQLIDTLVTATTGQKAGLSTSPDNQIKQILEIAAIALRKVSADIEAQRLENSSDGKKPWWKTLFAKVEEKQEKDHKDDGTDDNSDLPIVIIDNYLFRETSVSSTLWDELAEWSAVLVENGIAHVVFVSANVGITKSLGKVMPNKTFESILLSDAPLEASINYVTKHLEDYKGDDSLQQVVSVLGGRLTDLELLVQKMRAHLTPEEALNDIVQRNMIEIRKYGFGEDLNDTEDLSWSGIQFWQVVKQLATTNTINYEELKWGPFFKGADKPFQGMEHSELITIVHKDGWPHSIRPGKPVYQAAFDRLKNEPVFAATMDLQSYNFLITATKEDIKSYEEEINKLSAPFSGRPPREVESRIRYLLQKLADGQKAIEGYENQVKIAKDTISKQWSDV